jgi:hypothetical protein
MESSEQFDFSKQKDQEKFNASSPEVKKTIKEQAEEEAHTIHKFANKIEERNYIEAQKKIYAEAEKMAEKESMFEELKNELSEGNNWFLESEINSLSEEQLNSPELKQASLAGFKKNLIDGEPRGAIRIMKNRFFKFSEEEILNLPEIREAILEGFKESILSGRGQDASKLKNTFSIEEINKFINLQQVSEEVSQEESQEVRKILTRGFVKAWERSEKTNNEGEKASFLQSAYIIEHDFMSRDTFTEYVRNHLSFDYHKYVILVKLYG